MFENPFSPIFGGKPGVFFGRERILNLFEHAMIDTGSDDRAIFITGTRGSGKTALLEQFSIRAGQKKRRVFDLGPDDTIPQLMHMLADYDEETRTVSPQASVSVFGSGGSVSAGAISRTHHMGREDLQLLLTRRCKSEKNGILVTIDEAQKISLEDISALSNAFQMVSRKGHDIMLVVAGLPFAYNKVIQHEGCTYLRRATHEELGLFAWEETARAFDGVFSGIKGLEIEEKLLNDLNKASYGHPYLMQLLGYHLILRINDQESRKKYKVTEDDVKAAIGSAVFAYEQRALKPLVEELPDNEKKYLRKVAECLDDNRMTATADISRSLKVPANRLSRSRAYLIERGIIAAPEHGKVMFCIPYLAAFIVKEEQVSSNIDIARQRRV